MSFGHRFPRGAALLLALSLCACKSGGGPAGERPSATQSPAPAAGGAGRAALLDVSAHEVAPGSFKVRLETTKGPVVIEVHRDWAPVGADRFYHLVKIGFFDDVAFFRCIKGFMVQFGIHGDPQVSAAWRGARIADDVGAGQSNGRGLVTFATAGPNSRTTQLFINYANNQNLDSMGFNPIGQVVEGMEVVDALEGKYGEGAPSGNGPSQGRLQMEGNPYLRDNFPGLDYIKKATVL